jgi:hypothetical protein
VKDVWLCRNDAEVFLLPDAFVYLSEAQMAGTSEDAILSHEGSTLVIE